MIKTFLLLLVLETIALGVWAQPTAGTTGLLNTPSAGMQKDGTFKAGANYLPVSLTPDIWNYNTYNYYLNITFLPFLEISYRMTLFKLDESSHFNNQDRSLSARLRLLKEKKKLPAIVLGSNDIYSSENGFAVNRYFTSFYLAATKHLNVQQHNISGTLGYLYGAAETTNSKGIFGGISYSPPFWPALKLIGEYDSKALNAGGAILLFDHLYLQGMAYDLKYFSAGFAYLIYLTD